MVVVAVAVLVINVVLSPSSLPSCSSWFSSAAGAAKLSRTGVDDEPLWDAGSLTLLRTRLIRLPRLRLRGSGGAPCGRSTGS